MKQDNLRNNLKSIRTRLGMSQQDLASLSGVTRQTISGVESGQYAPSVAITLRLAKALGCQVEDLFWLEQDLPEIEAVLAKPVLDVQHLRVSLAKVGGEWIAYPLIGKDAFRQDMIPADGEAVAVDGFPGISKLPNPEGEAVAVDGFPGISKLPNPEGEAVAVVRQSDLGGLPQEELPKGFPGISKLPNPEGEAVAVVRQSDLGGLPQEELPKGFPGISKLPLASAVARNERHPEDEAVTDVDSYPAQLTNPKDISKLQNAEDENQIGTNKVRVRLLDDNIDTLHNTVVIAGCAPVISLWARATERWHPQLRVQYNFANSMAALQSLCQGKAHIAGMHLYDPETKEYNVPFVRDVLAGREAVVITLGLWEEGIMVRPGNPMKIKTVSDLVTVRATIVNRELGSGSRMLLEQTLQQEQVPFNAVQGFDHIVKSHQDVAQTIALGMADAGISTASVATTFGLGFVPLHQSRYDLVILKKYLEEAPVQQLLGTLGHRLVHSQLKVLGGYDTSKIGEVVATIY